MPAGFSLYIVMFSQMGSFIGSTGLGGFLSSQCTSLVLFAKTELLLSWPREAFPEQPGGCLPQHSNLCSTRPLLEICLPRLPSLLLHCR